MDIQNTKKRRDKLELLNEAMGRSTRMSNKKKRREFQKNYEELMEGEKEKPKVFKTPLDPDIIQQQQEAKTEREKEVLKRQKRRLFLDFFGCTGWR